MFKFGTIGGFKASNNPRVTCATDVVNGQAFSIVTDGIQETATAFANSNAVRDASEVWVVFNVIDRPELLNSDDFVIPAGSPIRAFKLNDIIGLTVELSMDVITGAVVPDVNAILIPDDDMNWRIAVSPADDGDYPLALQVMGQTTFGGSGVVAKIVETTIT